MNRLVLISLVLVLPIMAAAKDKAHVKTSPDQECYECHGAQAQVWQDGKHGLMNVNCVVCHGSPEKNFVPKPDIYKCRGCHGEQVKDVETVFPQKMRRCTLCHDPHAVTAKFHGKGGK